MRYLIALVLLGIAGCGAADTTSDPIVGTWILEEGTGAAFAGFKADFTYTSGVLAIASGSSVNAEYTNGTYSHASGVLTMTATESTCADAQKVSSVQYAVSASQMTWSDASTTLVFSRSTSPGTQGAIVTNGCFRSGVFTASPLAPL